MRCGQVKCTVVNGLHLKFLDTIYRNCDIDTQHGSGIHSDIMLFSLVLGNCMNKELILKQ